MKARGNGKDGLAQTPRRAASSSPSQRAMPRPCTTMTSEAKGSAGGTATSSANASTSASVRLLRWTITESARRRSGLGGGRGRRSPARRCECRALAAALQPCRELRPAGKIDAGDHRPGEHGGDVEIGDGEAGAEEIVAAAQRAVEHA